MHVLRPQARPLSVLRHLEVRAAPLFSSQPCLIDRAWLGKSVGLTNVVRTKNAIAAAPCHCMQNWSRSLLFWSAAEGLFVRLDSLPQVVRAEERCRRTETC